MKKKQQKKRVDLTASSQEETAELGRRQGGWGLSLRPLKNRVFGKDLLSGIQ